MPSDVEPVLPKVPFEMCPIWASLGVFGRKWSLILLRDMFFLKYDKFGQFLRNNLGLTPRALSMRLRDLQREGIIQRVVFSDEKRDVRYKLTRKGLDSIPILTAFIQYGIRHHADRVFEDGKPRKLSQVFPEKQPLMLGKLLLAYARETNAKLETGSQQ